MPDLTVNVDGYDMPISDLRKELANVVEHYPLWPGDTISHRTANGCRLVGWITRQADGNWIPTGLGMDEYERNLAGKSDA